MWVINNNRDSLCNIIYLQGIERKLFWSKPNMIHVLRLKYNSLEREKRIYVISFLLSLLLHVVFVLIFIKDIVLVDLTPEESDLPDKVTVLFPENKPKSIVENINENMVLSFMERDGYPYISTTGDPQMEKDDLLLDNIK